MRFALLLFALASCGDNTPPSATTISGARLRHLRYHFEDGASLVDRHVLFDAERAEYCEVTRFSSGGRFCMPVLAHGSTVFTDDRCTRVVGKGAVGEVSPAYFIRYYTLRGSVLPSRLYPPVEPVTAPAATWRQQDGDCLGPFPPEAGSLYYQLGEEVTTDDLVEIHTNATLEDTRLSLALDSSDDGWRSPGALTDRLLDLPCTIANAHCIPSDLPVSTYYSDDGCTTGLATAPRSLQIDTETGCAATLTAGRLHEGGVHERLDESCVTAPPESEVYEATSLPAAELTRTATGTTRIRPYELSRGSIRFFDGRAYDSELGTACQIAGDFPNMVCDPVAPVLVRTYFDDASCTSPIDVTFVPLGECEPLAPYARDAAGVRPVGPVRAAPIYELTTGDRCAAYTPPARFEVHNVGALVDPASYATAFAVHD